MEYSGFPQPTGKYAVGRTQMDFAYTGKAGSLREFTVFFFYPADDTEGKPTGTYAFPEFHEIRNSMLGAVGAQNEELFDDAFKTCCYDDLKVSGKESSYPVLIYNHGAGNFPQQGTLVCEDLASYGYIVAAMGHPDSGVQKMKDGRILPLSEAFLTGLTQYSTEVVTLYMRNPAMLMAKLPEAEAYENSRTLTGAPEAVKFGRFAEDQTEDTIYLLDCLEKINSGEKASLLSGKLRLSLGVGAFGHSFGGTVAAMACRDDARVVCGVNYDGNMLGLLDSDLKKPILQLCTPLAYNTNAFILRSNSALNYMAVIDNIHHYEFCDSLFTNKNPAQAGTRDPMEVRTMVEAYTKAFFDRYLLKMDTDPENLCFDGVEMITTHKS